MASTYSNSLRFELPGIGEQANTWGTTLNSFMGTLLEQAVSGYQTISMPDSNYTLTTANGTTDQARSAVVELSGTLSADRDVIAPLKPKVYFIYNNTNRQITIRAATGSGVQMPAGARRAVYCNGTTGFFDAVSDLPTGTLVGGQVIVTTTGSQTLTNKTLTSPRVGTSVLDSNGNEVIALTATASAVNEVLIANSATGNAVTIGAQGTDANISINLTPKGSGGVTVATVPVVTTTGSQTLTNKTLTTPAVGTAILDTNGNEILSLTPTASAVHEVNIRNAAAGGIAAIGVTSPDADVNLNLTGKGSGTVLVNNIPIVTTTAGQTLTNKTLTSPILTTPQFSSILNTGTLTLPTSTDTLVGRATTDTLTNKTIGTTNSITQLDGTLTIQNTAAPTKQVRFSAASVTAGVTRTVTVPDSDGTILYTNGSGTSLTGLRKIGKETIWIPALAMYSRSTNGAVQNTTELASNKIMLKTMDFADTTVLYSQFAIRMPKSWNLGTLTYSVCWTANSVSTNGVLFGLQAMSLANDETIDQGFGTAITVTDNNTATAYQIHHTPESSAITVGSTPAAQDYLVFQLYRDPPNGSDTLAATVNVLGLHLYYTTNAGDDT